jgi:tetratricopeptide (TPR) repeat protein
MSYIRLIVILGFVFPGEIIFSGVSQNTKEKIDSIVVVEDGLSAVDMYLMISDSFKSTNIDSASLYANRALEVAIAESDNRKMAESFLLLGKINLRRDSLINARDDFYEALKHTNLCECDSLKAILHLYLGKSYAFQDNYSEAISNFMKSLEIAEKINDTFILADLLDDIGLVFAFLMDYNQAMVYFEWALKMNTELDDLQNYATTLRNIGFVLQHKNQFSEAHKRYSQALEIYTTLNYLPGMSTSTLGIGNTEYLMKDYQNALTSYKKALSLAKEIKITSKVSAPYILALCYNALGKTYLETGNFAEAKNALQNSIDLCDQFGMPASKASAVFILSQMSENAGNIPQAFDYFKLYNTLSDSIINARNVSTITKMEMEYQYLKRQKQRELEQLRKDESHKRKVLMYEFLVLIAVVLLVLLIIVFILYRKNEQIKLQHAKLRQKELKSEKENLQKELDYKNKELTTSVMYQLKKNNFIWKTSEKLKEIALVLKPENQKSIKDLIKELDSNMSKESWEEFEYRFNEVHHSFYESLLKDYPDLTPNELKLAGFLKLNMTTKEIGTITYQSAHSITVARHRLRTKLKLERDVNLVSFFSKY